MNNNDRKNHSKTLAIAGMGFRLIATAFTFSFANSGQQLVNAQQNQTQTIVAVPFDTFTGSGVITASIGQGGQQQGGGGNATAGGGGGGQEPQYIVGGNWNLNVQNRNVTDFSANFIMVHPDGTEYHTHNITNFVIGGANTVQLVQGQETTIAGVADIYNNGTNTWPGANTTLTFTQNGAVMTIMPAPDQTDNHFQGEPIYGIVSALTGENGTIIAQTTPPGQQQEQQQQEEEEGGRPLAPLTEPFQDLFGGGGGQ